MSLLEKLVSEFGAEFDIEINRLINSLDEKANDWFEDLSLTDSEFIILVAAYDDSLSLLEVPAVQKRLTTILNSKEPTINLAHCATLAGNISLLRYTHEAKPELISQVSSNGKTTAYYAAASNNIAVLSYIKENCTEQYASGIESGLIIKSSLQANSLSTFEYILKQNIGGLCLKNVEPWLMDAIKTEGALHSLVETINKQKKEIDSLLIGGIVKVISDYVDVAVNKMIDEHPKIVEHATQSKNTNTLLSIVKNKNIIINDIDIKKFDDINLIIDSLFYMILSTDVDDRPFCFSDISDLLLSKMGSIETLERWRPKAMRSKIDEDVFISLLDLYNRVVSLILKRIEALEPADQQTILMQKKSNGSSALACALKMLPDSALLLLTIISKWDDSRHQLDILQIRDNSDKTALMLAIENQSTHTSLIFDIIKNFSSKDKVTILLSQTKNSTYPPILDLAHKNDNAVSSILALIKTLTPEDKVKVLSATNRDGWDVLKLSVETENNYFSSLLGIIDTLDSSHKGAIFKSLAKDRRNVLFCYIGNYKCRDKLPKLLGSLASLSEDDKMIVLTHHISMYSHSRGHQINNTVLLAAIQQRKIGLLSETIRSLSQANQIALFSQKIDEEHSNALDYVIRQKEYELPQLLELIETLDDKVKAAILVGDHVQTHNILISAIQYCNKDDLVSLLNIIKTLNDNDKINLLSEHEETKTFALTEAMQKDLDSQVVVQLITMIEEVKDKNLQKKWLEHMCGKKPHILMMAVPYENLSLIQKLLALLDPLDSTVRHSVLNYKNPQGKNILARVQEFESVESKEIIAEQIEIFIKKQEAKDYLTRIENNQIPITTILGCFSLCASGLTQAGRHGYLTKKRDEGIKDVSLKLILKLFYDRKTRQLDHQSTTLKKIFEAVFSQFEPLNQHNAQTSPGQVSLFQPAANKRLQKNSQRTHEYLYGIALKNKESPPDVLAKLLITEYEGSQFGPSKKVRAQSSSNDNEVLSKIHSEL